MSDQPLAPGTDDHTVGLLIFLAVVGTLTLTAVSFIVAAHVVITAWFFGRSKLTAFIALGAAAITAVFQPVFPGFTAFVSAAFAAYQDAFRQDHFLVAVAIEWLRFAVDPQAWLRLMPLGLTLGAVWVFTLESRKHSVYWTIWGA